MSDPWDDCGWTKSRYYSFIRSALRSATVRYPAKQKYLNQACRPSGGGRFRYVCDCEICGDTIGKSKAEVDHIEPAGSLRSYEDLVGFSERLFCGFDNFQILCSSCHEVKTLADRKGLTFKQAKVEKRVIAFGKLSPQEQKEILTKAGVPEEEMKNGDMRKDKCRQLIAKGKV